MQDTPYTRTRYTTAESVILERHQFFETLTRECSHVIESLYKNAQTGILSAHDFEVATRRHFQTFREKLSAWKSISDERTTKSLTSAEFYIELICKNAVRKYREVEKYPEMSLDNVLEHFSMQTKPRVSISRADLAEKSVHYNTFSISLVLNDTAAPKLLRKKTSGLYFPGTAVSVVRNDDDKEELEHTCLHEDIHALLDGANLGNPSVVSDFVKEIANDTALQKRPERYLDRMREEFLVGFIEAHNTHLFSDMSIKGILERYLIATITAGADTRAIIETLEEMIASEKNYARRAQLEDYLDKFKFAFLDVAHTLATLSQNIHALPPDSREAALLSTVVSLGILEPSSYSTYLLALPQRANSIPHKKAKRSNPPPQ